MAWQNSSPFPAQLPSWEPARQLFAMDCPLTSEDCFEDGVTFSPTPISFAELLDCNHIKCRVWSCQHLPFKYALSADRRDRKDILADINGAPTGANGRIDCFKFEVSCTATSEDDLEQLGSAFSVVLLLNGVALACGDDTALLGSAGFELSTSPELEPFPPPFGFFTD
ncbi:hypothetical protein H5410_009646 [Solanum commersonii]|uniref:Uncharacterized protein n=1 Tax=Solanum commersonii TaxID=4109 RepID=A0A9J6AJB9_SOLCO|nr:hypothetical protein H5410_009646 [Solanum commersonii]